MEASKPVRREINGGALDRRLAAVVMVSTAATTKRSSKMPGREEKQRSTNYFALPRPMPQETGAPTD